MFVLECTNGCSCSAITDQFSAGKQLYTVTLNGDPTTYACKQGADGRIWTVSFIYNLFFIFRKKKFHNKQITINDPI